MIKLENEEVMGWEHAIRGMRNPMNSWEKSDTFTCRDGDEGPCPSYCEHISNCPLGPGNFEDLLVLGPNDHELAMKLVNGGPVHAKYRRMITVYVDVTAPLYWWKEYDTYKVGTVANSCSTMHKIHEKEFTLDDFSHEHLIDANACKDTELVVVCGICHTPLGLLLETVGSLNHFRKLYLETKTKPMKNESMRAPLMKKYWHQMIQLLPSSYNQKRTLMLNYEVLANIYEYRRNHKLDEWREFCKWIESLPYSEIITGKVEEESDD